MRFLLVTGRNITYGLAMSKPKRKRKKHGNSGTKPANNQAETVLSDLQAQADEISQSESKTPGQAWGIVHKLLLKAHADSGEAARIIAARDVEGLLRAVRKLRGLEIDEKSTKIGAKTEKNKKLIAEIPPDILKQAMRAFRKRMKLIRLDHESKLGVGPMSGGKKADFDAIIPPNDFPRVVWEALVAAGRLKSAGQGFYMLCDDKNLSWD